MTVKVGKERVRRSARVVLPEAWVPVSAMDIG
jgi:hypothetical protein